MKESLLGRVACAIDYQVIEVKFDLVHGFLLPIKLCLLFTIRSFYDTPMKFNGSLHGVYSHYEA